MKDRINHITYYRVAGVLSILMCHFTSQHHSGFISNSAQLFNIGVNIFILASGYLAATNHINYDTSWFIKRIKRIYIPSTLFVFALASIYIYKNINFKILDWFLLLIGCQGTVVNVLGAEQTWFISVILLCYIITPLLNYIYKVYWKKYKTFICTGFFLFPFVFVLFCEDWYYTLLSPLGWYSLSFYLGKTRIVKQKLNSTSINTFILISLIIIMFLTRIVGHIYIHDTIFYRQIIVGYSHYVAAFCFLFLFYRFLEDKKPSKIIKQLDKYSFEIYLYHYMFCVGPVRLFSQNSPWIINSIIVFFTTLLFAIFAQKITSFIEYKLHL